MQVRYTSSVKVPAGWRSVSVVANVEKVSPAMAKVVDVLFIDGEVPSYGQSRTGAKRQEFNGKYWAEAQIGAKKRLSACEIIAD